MLVSETGEHNRQDLHYLLEGTGVHKHGAPIWCLAPWEPGEVWLRRCRIGVLQYALLKVALTAVVFITRWLGVYNEQAGLRDLTDAYVYVTVIQGISQFWALYCLVHFEHATAELLAFMGAFLKFVSIKLIVMFTFWQSLGISVITHYHGFDGLHLKCRFGLTDFAFSTSFEASLIALEMFIAAAAHAFVFSHMFYTGAPPGAWPFTA